MRLKSTITGDFNAAMADATNKIARAATGAIREAGDLAKTAGRAAIAAGGFGRKWQNALRVKFYPPNGTSLNPAAFVYHKISYAGVFQTGAVISGKPLLWLPLDSAPRVAGRPIPPARYIDIVGPLTKISPPGKPPMLVGRRAKLTNRTGGGKFGKVQKISGNRVGPTVRLVGAAVPLYVGISTVSISQKFDVVGAVRKVADSMPAIYARHMQDQNND